MTNSIRIVRGNTIEECRRRIDECSSLLERTVVPEYREALIAMAKAWFKLAEQTKNQASDVLQCYRSRSAPSPATARTEMNLRGLCGLRAESCGNQIVVERLSLARL